jgi:hypothetical protein
LAFLFPRGFEVDNAQITGKPDSIVENSGIASKYTSSEVLNMVENAINNGDVDSPECGLSEAKFHTFFSHRKYWKIAILCPALREGLNRATREYLYELNEWDDIIKHTP